MYRQTDRALFSTPAAAPAAAELPSITAASARVHEVYDQTRQSIERLKSNPKEAVYLTAMGGGSCLGLGDIVREENQVDLMRPRRRIGGYLQWTGSTSVAYGM